MIELPNQCVETFDNGGMREYVRPKSPSQSGIHIASKRSPMTLAPDPRRHSHCLGYLYAGLAFLTAVTLLALPTTRLFAQTSPSVAAVDPSPAKWATPSPSRERTSRKALSLPYFSRTTNPITRR